MKIIILVISLLLAGINLQSERLEPQDAERTKELARAVELSAQVVKLYNDRRYKEALPLAQQVVEIRQRLLSPHDLLLGDALFNLGELYLAEKRTTKADELFQSSLSIYESRPGSNTVVIAKNLERLAQILVLKGDYEGAIRLYLRSVSIREKEQGESNPNTVTAMKNYACTYLLARLNKGDVLAKDPEPAEMALKARAVCWLSEFVDSCAEEAQAKHEDLLNGKAVKLAFPPYPAAARGKGLSARVIVAVLIDESGNVIKARSVCGGHSDFNAVGVVAALSSKFSPTLLNQKPIRVTGVLIYNFVGQ